MTSESASPPEGDEVGWVSEAGDELLLSSVGLGQLVHAVVQRGYACRLRVKGRSMSPFIKDGDILVISPLTPGEPSIGDVVAFLRPRGNWLVVHRVVARQGNDYFLQGDSQQRAEGPLSRTSILGKVIGIDRQGRQRRWGLGPERVLIAYFTRSGIVHRVIRPLWVQLRYGRRKRT